MEKTALLVIDVQKGMFEKGTPVYASEPLLHNINLLIDAFHAHSLPVLFIRHTSGALAENSPGWQLHEALHASQDDVFLKKGVSDSFKERSVVSALEERSVKGIVVTGLVTHGCVKAACLGGLQRGYAVTLASDAHSSFNRDAAELIAEWNGKLAEAGAAVHTAKEIVDGLVIL
jgi:nicotinamidase-related amidase